MVERHEVSEAQNDEVQIVEIVPRYKQPGPKPSNRPQGANRFLGRLRRGVRSGRKAAV